MANVSPTLQKENRELIFDAFRRWGYLQADLDPLGDLLPANLPELTWPARLPNKLAAFTAAPSAPNSCTFPTLRNAAGFSSAWKRKLPLPTARVFSTA